MEFRFIEDKYCEPELIFENGGYYINQVKGNVERVFVNNDASTSLMFSCSAYTKSFSNAINFSLYSSTESTSGYWLHAMTKIMSYNKLRYYEDFFSITSMKNLIVFTIPKNHFGDRLKSGTLAVRLSSGEVFTSITGIDQVSFGTDPVFDIFPFYTTNNEAIISSSAYSASAFSGNIKGKLFPWDGFGILWDSNTSGDFSSTSRMINLINSITGVSWSTEILHTEIQLFVIKEPFQLNYSRNPSALKSLCSTTASCYSYGRDGLSGASSEYINSISALNTYVSTITYYNDNNECLAVSKLSKPIRLIKELPYSFRTILDLNIR